MALSLLPWEIGEVFHQTVAKYLNDLQKVNIKKAQQVLRQVMVKLSSRQTIIVLFPTVFHHKLDRLSRPSFEISGLKRAVIGIYFDDSFCLDFYRISTKNQTLDW